MAGSGHKSISRRNGRGSWRVIIVYKGIRYTQDFCFSAFADEDAALEAAIKWRDDKEKEIGKPRTDKPLGGSYDEETVKLPKGIRFGKNGGWEAFRVSVRYNGKRKQKWFSLRRCTKEAALAAAIKWRNEAERQLEKPRTEQYIRGDK